MRTTRYADIKQSDATWLRSGIDELDDVYGGGIQDKRVHLWAAAPGTGKSTLATQVAVELSKHRSVLYVSAEEGADAFRARVERLGDVPDDLHILESGDYATIVLAMAECNATVLVIDSIQRCSHHGLTAQPGSPSQVNYCAAAFKQYSIHTGVPIIMITHENRQGRVMGSQTLEHEVDTIMHMRKVADHPDMREFWCSKNRSGPADVRSVLAMTETGLRSVRSTGPVRPHSPAKRWLILMLGIVLCINEVFSQFSGGPALIGLGVLFIIVGILWSKALNRALVGSVMLLGGYRVFRWVTRG